MPPHILIHFLYTTHYTQKSFLQEITSKALFKFCVNLIYILYVFLSALPRLFIKWCSINGVYPLE